MRDAGLQEAIKAVGSVSELARRVGISQPSVSNWDRVPADRVLSVEGVTGINRAILRPDLFAAQAGGDIDEVDVARAQEYALLSALLARAPDAAFLKRLSQLRGDATPLGVAHAALADAAAGATVQQVEREYFDLFIGLGRGELMPYGSYYLTGFVYERPLARLRQDLAQFGIERADDEIEPEDHAAIVCEIMSGLCARRFNAPAGSDEILFEKHVAPWLERFFTDLSQAETAKFYRHVGTLGRAFIEIETEALALTG
jgi:TorA maturation chaperone TorD